MLRNPFIQKSAKMLSENARTPFNFIAKQLGLSTSNVIKKYNDMKEKGMFLRSTITLDLEKLGYRATAIVYMKIEFGTDFAFLQKELLAIPNLTILVKTIGEADLMAITPLATFDELFNLEATLRAMKGIQVVKINVNPTLSEWPFNYFSQVL